MMGYLLKRRFSALVFVTVLCILLSAGCSGRGGNVCMDVSLANLVVFSADGEGGNDLYLFDLQTKAVKPFVVSADYEDEPAFSPDGKLVAYWASRKPLSGGHIFIRSLDGRVVRQFTRDNGVHDSYPSFSTDGSSIVFMRANRLRDYSMGGKVWDDWDLFEIDVQGGRPSRLCSLRQYYSVHSPCYVLGGDAIVFAGDKAGEKKGPSSIVALDKPFQRSTSHPLTAGSEPSRSHDGKKIAFISDRVVKYDYEVWVMNGHGREQHQVTHNASYNANPVFTSDGKKLLFLSDKKREEQYELWMIGVDGTNATRIADSRLFANPLAWKP